MSAEVEFTMNVSGSDEMLTPALKPVVPSFSDSYLKKAISVSCENARSDVDLVRSFLSLDSSAVILTHAAKDETFAPDVFSALTTVRNFEKETRSSILVIISLTHVASYTDEAFSGLCRFVYTNGIDGILIKEVDSTDTIKHIRTVCLGMRGRRVRIILDGVSKMSNFVDHVDGIVVSSGFDTASVTEVLARQKLIFTRDPALTDSHKADLLVTPHEESSTPPTTVPSSPVSTSRVRSFSANRSFLYNELIKYMTPRTKLIISLSDDGSTASELSSQTRTLASSRFPPILGLSASESSVRIMGCLYGVIPLQTQSFISIDSVVTHAIAFAKERGLVEAGNEVVVVTQPPLVTASTNQSCFEGVVSKRAVV